MGGGKDFKTDAYVYQNQFIAFMNSFFGFYSKRKMQCKELFMNMWSGCSRFVFVFLFRQLDWFFQL